MNTMTYKGYSTRVEYDERDNICVFHAQLDSDSTRIWTVIP
jgi:hypothetical protein